MGLRVKFTDGFMPPPNNDIPPSTGAEDNPNEGGENSGNNNEPEAPRPTEIRVVANIAQDSVIEGDSVMLGYSYDHVYTDDGQSTGTQSSITVTVRNDGAVNYEHTTQNCAPSDYQLDITEYLTAGTNVVTVLAEVGDESESATAQVILVANEAPTIAVDGTTNPALMQYMHYYGYAASEDYMTMDEAAAVTSLPAFSSQVTHFDELQYFTGLTEESAWPSHASVQYITYPKTLTTIPAQFGSASAKRIIIPSTVTMLKGRAFNGASELQEVYCYARQRPTNNDAFFGYPTTAGSAHKNDGTNKIYVPVDSEGYDLTQETWYTAFGYLQRESNFELLKTLISEDY